jgi:conjugal transfer pilus assembly protein TrbC
MANFSSCFFKKILIIVCLGWSLQGFAIEQNIINKRMENFYQQTKKQRLERPFSLLEKKCLTCIDQPIQTNENLSSLLVFTSFSMPDSLWVSLSQELELIGGTFVLQGLPDNSFKELANKIHELRQKGVNADIQLHPQLFQDYQIHQVPTFVLIEKDKQFHQLKGNVSVNFVLSQFHTQCQSSFARLLLMQLQESNK